MQPIDPRNLEPQTTNFKQAPTQSSNEINMLDLLLILIKRWKMIVLVPLIMALITAIYTLCMPNIYTANTTIIPSDNDSGGMTGLMGQLGGLAALAGGSTAKTTVDLYMTMLSSETLKDQLIDKFRLVDRYEAKFRSDVYKTLNLVTIIGSGKKDGTITISVSDKDPKIAAAMANEYVDQLGKLATRLNMDDAGNNRVFLEKRISEARADLNLAENNLKEFQAKNKAISITEQAKVTIDEVAQLRAQLAAKEVQLGTLKRQFTDNSQDVKTAKTEISNIRAQIASLEGKGGISSSIPNLGTVPQLGQEYLKLLREFKIQESVLEMLTKQYEMAKITESKDTSPFQILVKAKVPERKSKPLRALIVIITTFATALLMLLLAFILECREWMNPEDQQRWDQIQKLLPNFDGILQRIRR